MIVDKVTVGFVVQRFDTESGSWLNQSFHAGTEVDWEENLTGEKIESPTPEPYLRFEMKQPGEIDSVGREV